METGSWFCRKEPSHWARHHIRLSSWNLGVGPLRPTCSDRILIQIPKGRRFEDAETRRLNCKLYTIVLQDALIGFWCFKTGLAMEGHAWMNMINKCSFRQGAYIPKQVLYVWHSGEWYPYLQAWNLRLTIHVRKWFENSPSSLHHSWYVTHASLVGMLSRFPINGNFFGPGGRGK